MSVPHGAGALVDARGRKYLTVEERTRFLAAVRAHRQVGALMAAAGIEGPQACPRGLRHGYGVAAVTAGVPLPTVAGVLGHASLETTAIYTTAIGAEARELVARVWA